MIRNGFLFLWREGCKTENNVCVIVGNWLIGKVVGGERHNDRVMKVNFVIGDVVWEVLSRCCPQVHKSENEKEFYELKDKVVTNEKVIVGGDLNSNVGSDMGGFGEVHGDFGIGQINYGAIRLLDSTGGKELHLMNTCFQKRKSRLIPLGETETMIDYILANNKYRNSVKDVKVIPSEEIVSQHCLMLIDMFKKKVKRKVKFRKKLKL